MNRHTLLKMKQSPESNKQLPSLALFCLALMLRQKLLAFEKHLILSQASKNDLFSISCGIFAIFFTGAFLFFFFSLLCRNSLYFFCLRKCSILQNVNKFDKIAIYLFFLLAQIYCSLYRSVHEIQKSRKNQYKKLQQIYSMFYFKKVSFCSLWLGGKVNYGVLAWVNSQSLRNLHCLVSLYVLGRYKM